MGSSAFVGSLWGLCNSVGSHLVEQPHHARASTIKTLGVVVEAVVVLCHVEQDLRAQRRAAKGLHESPALVQRLATEWEGDAWGILPPRINVIPIKTNRS